MQSQSDPVANDDNAWSKPPQSVCDILEAPREPAVLLSPDARHMLLVESAPMPDIADLARPMARLAGVRIDRQANTKFRKQFRTAIYQRSVTALDVATPHEQTNQHGAAHRSQAARINIQHDQIDFVLHDDGSHKIGTIRWSHDSHHFAFTVLHQSGTALFVASVSNPNAVLVHQQISEVLVDFEWMPSGAELLVAVAAQQPSIVDTDAWQLGPRIEQTDGDTSPTRTYQDLLKNQHDEALFAQIVTTELIVVGIDATIQRCLPPQMYASVSCSPDGNYLLVTTLKRPFSYLQTWHSFAMSIAVTDLDGSPICVVAEIPIAENIPVEGVRTQPRLIHWMSARRASLSYCQALDGGDPNTAADFRDQVYVLEAPFTAPPRALMKVQHRFYGLSFFADGERVITIEYDRDRRWITTRLYRCDVSLEDNTIMVDRSIRDRYGDPGHLLQKTDETGHYVVREESSATGDSFVFRLGKGATAQGNRPFLDCQRLSDMQTQRIWRCASDCLESAVALCSDGAVDWSLMTTYQSPTAPPNLRLWKLNFNGAQPDQSPNSNSTRSSKYTTEANTSQFQQPTGPWFPSGSPQALTQFVDRVPQIRDIKKELVTYQRSDGVQLSSTLYLPADHEPGQRLPLLIWAYPQEFNDPATAGQVVGNPQQFTPMRGITHLTLVTQGYAVMDNATMPIVGDPKVMNDTFVEQIVDAAESAINCAVDLGVADSARVAVGGHSYGAFMTANLMAHCDLFKAGIARSGAYNRTLTPFGFQAERRSLWEAPEIYLKVSPFMHADKIKRPLLIMHGEKDNNPGTFPLQSERLYQAIKGNGGTARLVILPHESHGYIARQSVLHTQSEMINWLDRHVKQPAINDR